MNSPEMPLNSAQHFARVGDSARHYASPLVVLIAFLATAAMVAALSLDLELPLLSGLGIYSLIACPICLAAIISGKRSQVVCNDAPFTPDDYALTIQDPGPEWRYSIRFAVSAFLIGGAATYLWAWQTAFPAPPPPASANCGLGFLAAPFILFFGPPIGATIASLVAGVIGAGLDSSLQSRGRSYYHNTTMQ